ncbi:hypothetical protein Ciccas_004305 [Cichlidogyrus casuarinus]|uniref:Uncharacterized protein n=1 Tax=Cichlidogyrus casuarinus TaxID=1844966 RepID=A0ABD2QE88_9PLAT
MSFSLGKPNGAVKKDCTTFEPQQWRKTVCKNCFKTAPEHQKLPETMSKPNPDSDGASTPTSSESGQIAITSKTRSAARKHRQVKNLPSL